MNNKGRKHTHTHAQNNLSDSAILLVVALLWNESPFMWLLISQSKHSIMIGQSITHIPSVFHILFLESLDRTFNLLHILLLCCLFNPIGNCSCPNFLVQTFFLSFNCSRTCPTLASNTSLAFLMKSPWTETLIWMWISVQTVSYITHRQHFSHLNQSTFTSSSQSCL